MQASLKLGEAMYKNAGASGAAGASGTAGADTGAASSEAPQDEKVVDADFEEVK